MEHIVLPVGPLQANCHVLWENPTSAIVIDPGDEGARIVDALNARNVKASLVLCTHGHFDHIGGVDAVRDAFGARFLIHRAEHEVMRMVPAGTMMWGIRVPEPPTPDEDLQPGQRLNESGVVLESIHTPGHTPGSTCFYAPDLGAVFTGDTLFQRSIGRSDFPGGNGNQLIESIRGRLLALPAKTVVYPGHGPASTIGEEANENPFLI